MAGKSFQFTLTTPQGKLLNIAASQVILPAHDGQMGVLPGRAPMVVKLGIGPLRVDVADSSKGEGGSRQYLVEEGFAHMVGDKLTILTSGATAGETLTEGEAQSELTKAEQNAAAATTDQNERTRRQKRVERARVAVRMARSGKGI